MLGKIRSMRAVCTETESRMDRALGGQEFDSVAEWAPDPPDTVKQQKKQSFALLLK